ncbi:MAG: SOS response-associated peptidase [Deltaproteobacteria bacterium]|nr:SOS response-associated peptidase [Deltaproteobacteria bacterium]NND28606.1 SOS response-associated peptidase [Myxococcales bacterium]MBT8463218.1 SOS response-associated peptidase [Deltaproteobacteria bacterium]MBT8481356.1 SOS response-associated peptidase [Deltaproteobacteria bacterium]NNK06974.1 SOS response-associated peptidase [Myxococcales bacterium]
MCGRYTLTCPDENALMANLPFDAFSEIRIEFRPRYNIAPGQRSPVIYLNDGKLVLADAYWGFERATGGLSINARSETAERTEMFRDAYRSGRCLVPADGFLEWRREEGAKQPYLFRALDASLFVMAGLWNDGRYVVLTRDSGGSVEDIHDRMPVILSRDGARQWLNQGELGEPPELLRTAVSERINRIENDDPGCIEPRSQAAFDFD